MLDAIDVYLLSKMQRFVDWIQRVFGIVKFDIQKWVVILGSVSYWIFTLESFDPVLVLFSLFLSFSAVVQVWFLELDKRNWLAGKQAIRYISARKDSNRKAVLVIQGALVFALSVIFLREPSVSCFWFVTWCLSDVANTYLGACNSNPPGKSKARELYEKLLVKLNNALQPTPVPVC